MFRLTLVSLCWLLVATGATDANIDLRGRLTAESYLAGARVLCEAGGSVTAPDGSMTIPNMSDSFET